MHPDINIAIARDRIAERSRAVEHANHRRSIHTRSPRDLRARLGRVLVKIATRLAPPAVQPGRATTVAP